MSAVGGVAGTAVAVLLSLVSAAGYALAAVAQSRLASASAGGRGALRRLLARPQWWWAVGLNAAGALAHVAALHYGPLTLVQPLGALTLVAALPIGAYGAHRRVSRVEWRGAAWTLAGLVGLVAVTGPVAPGEVLDLRETLLVTAVTLLLIALLAARGRSRDGKRGRDGRRGSGLGHATASGVASAVGSALTQTLTVALARDLPGGATDGAVGWWATALLAFLIAAFAVGGLLLSQAAYRGGLAAPLAVVNLANPAAAAVIGVALLGETFRAGVWGWTVAGVAALVAARGVVLLTTGLEPERSPAPESPTTGTGAPTAAPAPPRPRPRPSAVPHSLPQTQPEPAR
ncbi:DMT family transporter [Streptomyces roseicoloratus]|uniref:DMT family transporter n=1 Tax=Streptomyces roseicoloratus TaxID=2508722 RepID=A0ABY9RQS0_9ACTN|nr:DMT family transporter [Streptomyces roseicoloratus]WMX44044.1 DMT family transporter [Streptomyces roseicoloratus]